MATRRRRGPARRTAKLEAILGAMEILSFEEPADRAHGALRQSLVQTRQPIGANDLLIAAQALPLGFTPDSGNERESARLDNLRFENWLG